MAAAISAPLQAARSLRRAIGFWLLACAAMIAVMVMLGGATRLTQSGLSMVEWKPLSVLPPLSETQWQAAFQDYQQYPEFQKRNSWMTVENFKTIYWLEYIHRLWGRMIGVVFLLPFLWLVARRAVDRPLAGKLAVLFVLGALQGALGWFMVASGLENRPDVSQYRLAAHLISAFVLYGFTVWLALDQFGGERLADTARRDRTTSRLAFVVVGAVLAVATAGALVAGLKAGLIYNTFPLMDGHLGPPGGFDLSPWYINFFENLATVQFDHRLLAIALVALILSVWVYARRQPIAPGARLALHALAIMAIVQAGLGISTLLLVVPLPLALTHQSGALALFTLAICFAHEVSVPARASAPVLDLALKPAE